MYIVYNKGINVYVTYAVDNLHTGFNKTGFNKWLVDVIDFWGPFVESCDFICV